jgi:hypothetical protein
MLVYDTPHMDTVTMLVYDTPHMDTVTMLVYDTPHMDTPNRWASIACICTWMQDPKCRASVESRLLGMLSSMEHLHLVDRFL